MENLIYSYTRKLAIEDGVLVDVSETAKVAGIGFPVAFTRPVWSGYVIPPASIRSCSDWEARLWDVLACLKQAASNTNSDMVRFVVSFQMTGQKLEDVVLKAICGPGDTSAPVITVMLPEED